MNIVTRDVNQVTQNNRSVTEGSPATSQLNQSIETETKVEAQQTSEPPTTKDLTSDAKGSRCDAKRTLKMRDGVDVTSFEVDASFCFDHGDCIMDMSVDGNFVMTVGSDAKIKLWVVTLSDADEGHLRRIVSGKKKQKGFDD